MCVLKILVSIDLPKTAKELAEAHKTRSHVRVTFLGYGEGALETMLLFLKNVNIYYKLYVVIYL